MSLQLLHLVLATVLAIPSVDTKFARVAPESKRESISRTAHEDRAVVLVQGLYPHSFSDDNVAIAMWQDWQEPESDLVQKLGKESDVYSLAYAQHLPVHQIGESARLREKIDQLDRLGYEEIVLVGHSAGGLIARQFVEDHPDSAVTKVVQVCAPNGGSMLGNAEIYVRRSQEVFLTSLTSDSREQWLAERAEKLIPANIEFVCVVGHKQCRFDWDLSCRFFTFRPSADVRGDWIVSSKNQWSCDLQDQGIPVVPVSTCHLWIVQQEEGIETISRLVREEQPRWTPTRVQAARRSVLGEE
jgi:hypothetical protein